MPEARIRPAKAADLPALQDLERTCFQPHRRASPGSLRRSVVSPHQSVWVIDGEGGLAALLILWHRPRTWRVYDIATHPAHRGQGLGGRLMDHAERLARRAGARTMVLEADPKEPGLVDWYQARGYAVTEHRPGYYAPRHPAVRMAKPLA